MKVNFSYKMQGIDSKNAYFSYIFNKINQCIFLICIGLKLAIRVTYHEFSLSIKTFFKNYISTIQPLK